MLLGEVSPSTSGRLEERRTTGHFLVVLPSKNGKIFSSSVARRLGAVLADLEALGIFDGLSLLVAQELDQLGPESVGQAAVALCRPGRASSSAGLRFSLGTSPR